MKNKTYIYFILDKSGSMSSILTDTIGGFNSFLRQQREISGDCEMSVRLFDTTNHELTKNQPLALVDDLTMGNYVPMGGTALYDAIGSSIDELGKYLASLPEDERPEKVLVTILTDGGENSSKTYTYEQISSMIKHQTEVYNWDFIFLAANQDAMAVADSLSISKGNAMNFSPTKMGVTTLYDSFYSTVSNYRSADSKKLKRESLFSEAGIDNTKTV